MKAIFKSFITYIEVCGNKMGANSSTFYSYQIARSFLAFATLCTIIFSPTYSLFTLNSFNSAQVNNSFLNTINLFYLVGYFKIYIAKIISAIILVSVITGYFHKITGILHWYISFSFYTALTIVDGGDQIAAIVTLLLIPIGLCDNRKNTWRRIEFPSSTKPYFIFLSNCFLMLIQIQIAVIYLNSGVAKIFVDDWMNGSAYYYWFTHNAFGAPDYIRYITGNLFSHSIIVALITWGTIIFEITLFGCFFSTNKRFKNMMFIIGVIFHLLIFVVHGLFSFCLIMLGCLYLYLKSVTHKYAFLTSKTVV